MMLRHLAIAVILSACSDLASDTKSSNAVAGSENDSAFVESVIKEFRASDNASVRRAIEMKIETDTANTRDLEILSRRLHVAGLNRERLITSAKEQIAADKTALTELQATLTAAEFKGKIPDSVSSSLRKLIGVAKHSGILDDAVTMLDEKPEVYDGAPQLGLRHNEITVAKTALIYLNAALGVKPDRIFSTLKMVYPAPLPVAKERLPQALLLVGGDSPVLMVPHSGFVFGGNLVDGDNRGTDCSSYLSCATESPRLTTMVMEYAWRIGMGDTFAADDAEGKIREEFKKNFNLGDALGLFTAVDAKSTADLKAGDLITWRWRDAGKAAKSGHVVMFLKADADAAADFIGIENNREDDKSLEGIHIRRYHFNTGDREVYVLRRK